MNKDSLKVYKYLSAAKAVRLLTDGELYFAGINQLNDTLEAKFDHASAKEFMDVADATYRELFMARGETYDASFKHDIPSEFLSVNESENLKFSEFVEGVGIFATALRPNHQAMWAYYADNSNGVCFEFEFSEDLLKQYQLFPVMAKYKRDGRVHNRAIDWREAFMGMAKDHPDDTVDQLHERSQGEEFRRAWGVRSAGRAASVKHTDWEHEQELRLISAKAGPRKILKESLKAVHFARTDYPGFSEITHTLFKEFGMGRFTLWKFETGNEDGADYQMSWQRTGQI